MFLRLCSPKSSKVKSSRSPIWSRTVPDTQRSEEHTSELQSRFELVCRLLLEKKNRQPPDLGAARHHRLLLFGLDIPLVRLGEPARLALSLISPRVVYICALTPALLTQPGGLL